MDIFVSVAAILITILIITKYIDKKLNAKNTLKNNNVLDNEALNGLNHLVGGKLYSGANSAIVSKNPIRWLNSNSGGYVRYLCKTSKGNWFNLDIVFSRGEILERSVTPAEETEVKTGLQRTVNSIEDFSVSLKKLKIYHPGCRVRC